jgi:hypothetical protein
MGYFFDGSRELPAGQIVCETSYSLRAAKNKTHKEMTVMIADHSVSPWNWRYLKAKATSLEDAKSMVVRFFSSHPEMQPNFEEKSSG